MVTIAMEESVASIVWARFLQNAGIQLPDYTVS
jgi:hypothetical protein